MKKCIDCKYCLLIDEGYSNWTVEGITANCLLNKNPDFPEDAFYKEEESLLFANKCNKYKFGNPVKVDVEREKGELYNYSNEPEIIVLLKLFENSNLFKLPDYLFKME